MNKKDWIFIYLFTISLSFSIVLLWTFYHALLVIYPITNEYWFCARMDAINEFWFEFIMLHCVIVGCLLAFWKFLKS